MKKKSKKALLFLLGIACLFLGVLGLVLPFLQGFLFIGLGLILLSPFSPRLREWVGKHSVPYPSVHRKIRRFERWLDRFLGV